ncbi:dephospho-CoA kinase [Chloroflexota bacterium]
MKVIGLTGGIGSGKSTVSKFLAELGAVILNADEVGHEALKPDTKTWHKVVTAFGNQILTPAGNIDRKKLGKLVFGNPESISRLNRIMHPLMYEMVKARLEDYRQQGTTVVVLEAPLLLEAGWTPLVDEVWMTAALEATVLKRLEERSGMSHAESLARIRSQLPAEERGKYADIVINTDCDPDELKARVKEFWQRLELDTLSS